jgi:hypothetical protein
MNYKTPQEAIAACEAENERAWNEYLKVNRLDPKFPEPGVAAKTIFRAGYMAGVRFVSRALVEKLMSQSNPHITEPSPQS